MSIARICALGRLKRLGYVLHPCPKTLQHGADHVVAQNQDALRFDLCCQMPVADVPGKFPQQHTWTGNNFEQVFFRSDNLNQTPVIKHQRIAMFEQDRLRQVHHDMVFVHQR